MNWQSQQDFPRLRMFKPVIESRDRCRDVRCGKARSAVFKVLALGSD
jgi:hypothetical protein